MTTPHAPAGWYADPDGSGGQRYWDGHRWTEHQDGRQRLLMRYLAVCTALLAVLVAVAVYATFFADDGWVGVGASDDPTMTLTPTMTPTTTADGGWGEPPTVSPTPPDSMAPTDGALTDGATSDGALAFSVDTVEITPSISSVDYPVDKTAAGEYVVVHMTVTNTSDEPVMFLGTFQKLTAGGVVYSIDDEATFYAQGARADLNPGEQAQVAVAFDVPPGTDPESIELHTDPLTSGVEVPLP
ncbi:hypothetical protein NGTWS1803_11020 [Mycolicibacterium cyprinidarum]|nr:hypothetical protein NGTWS1803_11020 [Mycolicibacterium sp. NGTWS1803]